MPPPQSKTSSTASGSRNVLAQYIHIPGSESKVRDHCEHGGSFLLSLSNSNSLLCPSQHLNTWSFLLLCLPLLQRLTGHWRLCLLCQSAGHCTEVVNRYLVGYSDLGFTCHSEESVRVEKGLFQLSRKLRPWQLGNGGEDDHRQQNRALHPQRHRGTDKLAFISSKRPLMKMGHRGCLILPLPTYPKTAVSRRLKRRPQRMVQCLRLKGAPRKEKKEAIQSWCCKDYSRCLKGPGAQEQKWQQQQLLHLPSELQA